MVTVALGARQPTAVFLPGESHGQRSLAGCSPWGHKDSDTTEVTTQHSTQWGLDSCFSGNTSGKEPNCQCRRHKRWGFDSRVGKIPWRRAWQPTPVFLPGKAHGQRSLVGYSPWGLRRVGHNLVSKQ